LGSTDNGVPQITGVIGLSVVDLPAPPTLWKTFDRICMNECRVLLRQSAQLHNLCEHATIDPTFYQRSAASRRYCERISYRLKKLKSQNSLIQRLKLSLTFTAQRTGKDAIQISPSSSPVEIQVIFALSPLI
jgi:hypothetical protein